MGYTKKIIFCFATFLFFPYLSVLPIPLSNEILSRLAQRQNLIQDMTANVSFKIKLAPLWGGFHFEGKVYYKKPNKVRLILKGVPEILKKHQDAMFRSADVMSGLPTEISKEYHVKTIRKVGSDYVLVLLPNEKRRVSKVYAWVNPANYTLPKIIFQYHDGSSVRLWNQYVHYHDLYLLQNSKSIYNFTNPSLEADVTATFSHFKVNTGIPDSIFQEN
jgi:hypothetical protein